MLTTRHDFDATQTFAPYEFEAHDHELMTAYQEILRTKRLHWTVHHRLQKRLGSGGQGVVYLTERKGADGFTLPVALKIFSPAHFETPADYEEAMQHIARVAVRVAQIQQDHLLDVHNFVDRNGIRMMVMEWVDGFNLRQVLDLETLENIQQRVSPERWESLNDVVATAGPQQARIKPGVAMAIVRECLAALAALHRSGVVHGDIKPANIMLKRTGNAKIVDIGSAFELEQPPKERSCTPAYAAPEVLTGDEITPRSDLASLGYVLVEMLSGQRPFLNASSYKTLLSAKLSLADRLKSLLPPEVAGNQMLMNFCRGLIAADPKQRFPNAETADLIEDGAAAFQRQLVKSDLSSEYDNEIRLWIEEVRISEIDIAEMETR